jgi:hypothetical protein
MPLSIREIKEALKTKDEGIEPIKALDMAILFDVLKPENPEEIDECWQDFKGFTKAELESMANKVIKRNLKHLPKFSFQPPFKVFKTSELVWWYKALGRIKDPAIKLSALELLNNLLVEEVRLLIADCQNRVTDGGEELVDTVEDSLYGGLGELNIDLPFWLKQPFLLTMRDIVARELIFALSTSFKASLKTDLDSLIVVVEKLMGILDWHDAVQGDIFAPKDLMTRLCWIRHFDASRFDKLIAGWQEAYTSQNLKDRAEAFHKLASLKRLIA